MNLLDPHTGLYTDHYELTMAQGYFLGGKKDTTAEFDYHFRQCPYQGGFVVLTGHAELLDMLEDYRFTGKAVDYLGSIGFDKNFLDWLGKFRFSGYVHGVREGEIVFPHETCLRIGGNLIEAQLVETLVLNIMNFSSLVSTKAARIRQAAGENRNLMDFGLRRAHGTGGVLASRAAVCGGFNSTSNVFSAFQYGLRSTGTMAHSWVQSFDDELTAFRTFARLFPEKCILLVDTYDTLNSGIPNAIKVAQEMGKEGKQLTGVRLDSGDLSYLSKKARRMLDLAGLESVQIVASNQLDEEVISSLLDQSAPLDSFGVGTALVTGKGSGALDGVYKLSMVNGKPTMKLSESLVKTTLPGQKSLYRYSDRDGNFQADGIALEPEEDFETIFHPFESGKSSNIAEYEREPLLRRLMKNGKKTGKPETPERISEYVASRLGRLPDEHKRFLNPHIYRVGISPALLRLRDRLLQVKEK